MNPFVELATFAAVIGAAVAVCAYGPALVGRYRARIAAAGELIKCLAVVAGVLLAIPLFVCLLIGMWHIAIGLSVPALLLVLILVTIAK